MLTWVCTYIHIHTACKHISRPMRTHRHTHTHAHACTQAHVCACVSASVHVCKRVCMQACAIYTNIHHTYNHQLTDNKFSLNQYTHDALFQFQMYVVMPERLALKHKQGRLKEIIEDLELVHCLDTSMYTTTVLNTLNSEQCGNMQTSYLRTEYHVGRVEKMIQSRL